MLSVATVLLAGLPAVEPQPAGNGAATVVYADRVFTSTGKTIEGGLVTVVDGKITSVTPGAPPSGDDALRAKCLTAGMIDLSVRIHPGFNSVEQSKEIQPHLRVADSLDPFSTEWTRQLKSGVTTVLANPLDENVIGGLGIALKTGGEPSIEARTVKADAVVRGAIGTQPSGRNHPAYGTPTDFYSRRPTTRMGVEWEWRKAYFDAGASTRDESYAFPGSDVLVRTLKGELPVMIQAWATQDIRTAIFLQEELKREGLGELELILDAAAECWREPEMLKRSGAAVVLPPFSGQGRMTDGAFMPWNVAKLLHDLEVPFALSSHGAADAHSRLEHQATHAIRGGLPFEAALEAVTIAPARMLGIDGRVGSIEVGKDADLVLWSGVPFEPTSRVVGVFLNGELVVDPRE